MQEFDKILNFDIGNRLIYDLLCKDMVNWEISENGIIPFIGDALSEFSFGSKANFIKYLVNILLENTDITEKENVINNINNTDFLDSLETITKLLGAQCAEEYAEQIVFNHLIHFYNDKKVDVYALQNQAVSLVPLINNGDSITTNFDHVLEYAYEQAGINPGIATPYDFHRLNRKIRSENHCNSNSLLFKIHGDITSNAMERIITRSSFEEHYRKDTDFSNNLSKWLAKYKILFIGIDILKDQYLQQILKNNSSEGLEHYAIIGCKNNDNEKKELKKQLGKFNILPIIYDIDKPNSIEMLLHKLLVDTKTKENRGFFKRGIYHYKYSEHDLVGREKEIEKLNEFLMTDIDGDTTFKWWLLWGINVSGKSKLAYDFARKLSDDWIWYIVDPGQIDSFLENQKLLYKNRACKKSLFIVFDDFDCYRGDISNLLNIINALVASCVKIRVLFISQKFINTNLYKALSDKSNPSRPMLIKTAYAPPCEIGQLSVNEIIQICLNYIWYRKKSLGLATLTEQKLQEIIPELREYINELIADGQNLLLLCSLEKAIRLILNRIEGDPKKLNDKEIIAQVLRYILTEGEGNYNNANVDIIAFDQRKDERKATANFLLKKYDSEKEYDNDLVLSTEKEFSLALNEKGDSI